MPPPSVCLLLSLSEHVCACGRTTLNDLNLEIYGIDQNYVDVGGIGGDAGGHSQVDHVCGSGHLASRLQTVGHSGSPHPHPHPHPSS
jgi:hypothetical protein